MEEGRADLLTKRREGQINRLRGGKGRSTDQKEGRREDLQAKRRGWQIYKLGGGKGRSAD